RAPSKRPLWPCAAYASLATCDALMVQEQPDLFKEPPRRRFILQEQMVAALQRYEPGAANAGGELPAVLDRNSYITAHVQHQRRYSHLSKKIAHIHIAGSFVVSGCAFRRCGFALQFVECVLLLLGPIGKELLGKHLSKSCIFRAPSQTHQGCHRFACC